MDSETRFRTLDERFKIKYNDEERKEVEEMLSLHDSFYEGYVSYGKELGMAEGYSKGAHESMIETTSRIVASISIKLDITVEKAMDLVSVPSEIINVVRQRTEQLLKEQK